MVRSSKVIAVMDVKPVASQTAKPASWAATANHVRTERDASTASLAICTRAALKARNAKRATNGTKETLCKIKNAEIQKFRNQKI